MVALAGSGERVLFPEHYLITSPNAKSIHYLGTKTLKDKKEKSTFILIFPIFICGFIHYPTFTEFLMVTIKSRKLVCFVDCHT